LICMKNFQKCLVDVRLSLESVLDFIDIIYGMVKFHRLLTLCKGKKTLKYVKQIRHSFIVSPKTDGAMPFLRCLANNH